MFVYVINGGADRHKIGMSKSPEGRLSELQTGHFETLTLVYSQETSEARAVEQDVHTHLARWRIRGEWFDCPESVAVGMVRSRIEGEEPDPCFDHFGGWGHAVGDVVECRKVAPPWMVGDLPSVGRFYTISEVSPAGWVDLAECSNAHWYQSPCMFWPAFGRLRPAA